MHLDEIIEEMKTAHAAGQDVARVHSGDPAIYGAVAEQMRRLDALGDRLRGGAGRAGLCRSGGEARRPN
jgi:precorrin-4 methylase